MPERPKGPRGKSLVTKRSIRLYVHKSSVALEDAFWAALKEIAIVQKTPVSHLIAAIDKERRKCQYKNLSSAIRLFVLDYYRSRCHR